MTAATIRIEDTATHASFTRLSAIAAIAGVAVDLRYASTNNFAGRVLYGGIDCDWLRVEAAQGLQAAAAWLATHHRGQRLLVLDALRPQRVQEAIWRDVKGSAAERYFADPAHGSIHSFGMAVDVTLLDAQGRERDMGSGFDEMSLRSHPALEAEQFFAGHISSAHRAAREVLRAAMRAGGFGGIATEWWHFNHGDAQEVRAHFVRVD